MSVSWTSNDCAFSASACDVPTDSEAWWCFDDSSHIHEMEIRDGGTEGRRHMHTQQRVLHLHGCMVITLTASEYVIYLVVCTKTNTCSSVKQTVFF